MKNIKLIIYLQKIRFAVVVGFKAFRSTLDKTRNITLNSGDTLSVSYTVTFK